jgi:rRNA-processing protein FCF1
MRPETDQARLVRHAAKGIILDTNLLVILLVGLHDQKDVERFLPGSRKGRVVCFPGDFGILQGLFQKFGADKFIVTPQILAEVSNLTFDSFIGRGVKKYIDRVLDFATAADEKPSGKDTLLGKYHLRIVGFADSSIIEAAKNEGCLVLTEDLKCAAILQQEGCCVYNMNHLRTLTL